MLTEPLVQQLTELRLRGMAAALAQQSTSPDRTQMSFEDRLGIMIQHEITERASFRLAQRLRWARLPLHACLEDLDTRTPRGIDPAELRRLTVNLAEQIVESWSAFECHSGMYPPE